MSAAFPLPDAIVASYVARHRAEEARERPCGEGIGDGRTCGSRPASLMARGARCAAHRPASPAPDPTRTLAALRARARQET